MRSNFMNKLFAIFTLTILLVSCGGGGYGYPNPNPNPNPYGTAPIGDFAGQVDPVQATD